MYSSGVLCSFVLLSIAVTVESANLLLVFPVHARSHHILCNGVARVLVEAGHNVTIITPFTEKNPPTNGTWNEILLAEIYGEEPIPVINFFLPEYQKFSVVPMIKVTKMIVELNRKALSDVNVQKLIHSNQTFDAVIAEQFNNDAIKGFAAHFGVPLIILSSLGANAWVNPLVGNPSPPSYIPEFLLNYSDHMTFFERFKNTLFALFMEFARSNFVQPTQNKLLQEYFPNPPNLNNVLYNVSLVLLNSHPSYSQPKPKVPAMVEIGGYHIDPPKKLPEDLQQYLDDATEGVVYFSMGSYLQSAKMPEHERNIFIRALSKLKQKVLWKYEDDVLPEQPKNVKIAKWFPQNDILAHPNVKLFITHGGLLSTTETVYHGKPILAIPIFGDQRMNAHQAVNNGFAISLNYRGLKEEELTNALNELLYNPKYYENAQRRSRIMLDRPQTPRKTLVYWVEYIIRHKGAPHLRVAAMDLEWYQYLLLDVAAFLIFCTVVTFYVFKFIFRKLFKNRRIVKTTTDKKKVN